VKLLFRLIRMRSNPTIRLQKCKKKSLGNGVFHVVIVEGKINCRSENRFIINLMFFYTIWARNSLKFWVLSSSSRVSLLRNLAHKYRLCKTILYSNSMIFLRGWPVPSTSILKNVSKKRAFFHLCVFLLSVSYRIFNQFFD